MRLCSQRPAKLPRLVVQTQSFPTQCIRLTVPGLACDAKLTMQEEVINEIELAQKEHRPLVVATVAATRGSTPRKPGAKMVVRPDGSFRGTIGGGCGEAEVWQEAMNVLESGSPSLMLVDLTESPEGEDKICGGIMEVFVERIV